MLTNINRTGIVFVKKHSDYQQSLDYVFSYFTLAIDKESNFHFYKLFNNSTWIISENGFSEISGMYIPKDLDLVLQYVFTD